MSNRSTGFLWACFVLAMAACSAAHAADTTTGHYTGVAYDPETSQVRYREEHWLTGNGKARQRLVLYRCPDGRPFARKLVRYTGTAWVPDFEYEDARSGHRESVKVEGERIIATVSHDADKSPRTGSVALHADTVVDAGFDDFVKAHWSGVSNPKGMTVRFVVPSRLDDLRLVIRPDATSTGSPSVRQFRMTLDGWLGAFAPTVSLAYTEADHRLIGFEGPSNIKSDDGKNRKVRIVFPSSDDRPPVSPDEIASLRVQPLVTSCSR
ncbi:hypothetical protein L2Y94_10775 [Luteibacter aegosomatis]|uniref:hypothetical protein n=1 Tax=Luteibacter aegosomatis TaxID=2911537 RepID=UPI001FF82AA1|nr:hypothetical protein [Luteibacter aegosomatis]UPG83843.1 hypothetical protein L2Y94_10775 [Luteibacter aegosomatis]